MRRGPQCPERGTKAHQGSLSAPFTALPARSSNGSTFIPFSLDHRSFFGQLEVALGDVTDKQRGFRKTEEDLLTETKKSLCRSEVM
jgi:hypothetical protein